MVTFPIPPMRSMVPRFSTACSRLMSTVSDECVAPPRRSAQLKLFLAPNGRAVWLQIFMPSGIVSVLHLYLILVAILRWNVVWSLSVCLFVVNKMPPFLYMRPSDDGKSPRGVPERLVDCSPCMRKHPALASRHRQCLTADANDAVADSKRDDRCGWIPKDARLDRISATHIRST